MANYRVTGVDGGDEISMALKGTYLYRFGAVESYSPLSRHLFSQWIWLDLRIFAGCLGEHVVGLN